MKKLLLLCHLAPALLLNAICFAQQQQRVTLAIGSPAPDFSLRGIDGKNYSLSSFKNAKLLVIIFMCNHCPTSQAYEQRIIQLTNDYKAKGVAVAGINPNNPTSLRLDELGYSDVGDSYDDMKLRAKDAGFNFPYLYDGETEATSNKYGPVSTPHVFIFDSERKLRYQGRVDDTEDPHKTPNSTDARNAIEALLNNQPVPVETTKVFGCSIKWLEKKDWLQKAAIKWAKEPVDLYLAGEDSIKGLLKNSSDKLRLICLWSASSAASVKEFPFFITMHHMYRDRGFEFMSINIDSTGGKNKLLAFLKAHQASGPNYLFTGAQRSSLVNALTPQWNGTTPCTLLVEPGGKVVYTRYGMLNPEELRKIIFFNPMMGRIYN